MKSTISCIGVPGWKTPARGVTRFEALPAEARRYIARLEEVSGVPVAIVSTGSDRAETIVRDDGVAARWFPAARTPHPA